MLGALDAAFTVNRAEALFTLPPVSLTVTSNLDPLSPMTVAGMLKAAEVAPEIAEPLRCHWYVSGDCPVASTTNCTGCPAVTD